MPLLEQYVSANRFSFYQFNMLAGLFGLGDSDVNIMTTWAGTNSSTSLQGWINARTPVERLVPLQRQIADGMSHIVDLGISTNTALGTADTVANARNLFIGNDANLAGTAWPSFAFPV